MKRLEMYNKKTTEMFDYYVVIDYEATCDENHKNFEYIFFFFIYIDE
jgi:hypothetical protein